MVDFQGKGEGIEGLDCGGGRGGELEAKVYDIEAGLGVGKC